MTGFVYLARSAADPGLVKIGLTDQPRTRFKALRLAPYFAPEVLHTIRTNDPNRLELFLHVRFRAKREDREYFRLSADDLAAVRRVGAVDFTRPRNTEAIREWRRQQGWSREKFRRALGGVAYDTARCIEASHQRGASVRLLVRLAALMGVPPETLV